MGAHLFSDLGLRLSIVPFGGTDRKDVADLAHELELLGTTVNVLQPVGLPGNAYNPRRRQYRAEALLTLVEIPDNDRVLAITHEDLYAGDLNFVFGIAQSPGKVAVISLRRLHIGASEKTFLGRAVKEAVHELGHTLGLRHCSDPNCVMHFSNSLENTDRKGKAFCGKCAARLERH